MKVTPLNNGGVDVRKVEIHFNIGLLISTFRIFISSATGTRSMSLGRVMAMRKGSASDLSRKPNGVVVNLPPVVKKSSKSRSFHFRYMELCRAKNLTPVPEIRSKSNTTTFLELCGDKLGVSDWLLLTEALQYDLVLQQLTVRLRRTYPQSESTIEKGDVLETRYSLILFPTANIDPIDTEKRARLFRQRPVIYTKFIFYGLVQAIANCVSSNKNLSVLKLEGLPLHDGYIDTIAKVSPNGSDILSNNSEDNFLSSPWPTTSVWRL